MSSYVCFARVPDLATAQVAAARLASEGITARIHGESTGPFPVTIGRLAETELWVRSSDRSVAQQVLVDAGILCISQDLDS